MKQQLKIDISKYHSIKPKPKPIITPLHKIKLYVELEKLLSLLSKYAP